jgi:WS/DGAT/MGAT family acyltransferase
MGAERTHMPNADAAWLHMDRPTNLMVINSVLLFDEPLDWERLTDVVRRRLVGRYPRFSQRVVESRLPLRGPSFQNESDFDLDRHMHRRGLPAPGDMAALKRLAGDLAATPLDRGKPLWDMYLLDGPGAGSAVLVRMHHCIADGIALARVMLSLTDTAPEGDLALAEPQPRAPRRSTLRAALDTALDGSIATVTAPANAALAALSATGRLAATAVDESLRTLAHPAHARELAGTIADDAQALAKLLFTPSEDPSSLKGDLGAGRAVAWSEPLSLAQIKVVAHAQEATVNDVLLSAVSGALRAHLIEHGETPHEIRTFVPFNLRPRDQPVPRELGNRFGLVFLTLPVHIAGRSERLRELKRRMDSIKDSPEGPISYAILEAVGLTPPGVESRIVDIFTAKASAVMTNVPGPRETVYLAGTPLRTVLVWAPTSGSVGMSVSIFSYHGEVTVGLLVHSQLVPNPQAIVDRVQSELKALARLKPAKAAA